MLNTIAQLAIGTLLNPSAKPIGPTIRKLVFGLLGIIFAAIIGSFALAAAVVSAVLWYVPETANPASVSLIVAGALGVLALTLWFTLTKGHTPQEMIDKAFDDEPTNPLTKANNSLHNILRSFERGWENSRH